MTAPATYSRVLPSPAERRLAQRLGQMDGEITSLWDSLRTAQLGTSSLSGTIPIRDSFGVLVGIVGTQPDGTTGLSTANQAPPPRPNTADLSPFPAGLGVGWNGSFPTAARPVNFRNVECYLGTSPTFIPGPSNFVGTLGESGVIPVAPLPYVPHYAILIATNMAEPPATVGTGVRSTASDPSLISAPATPLKVVADAVLQGVVDELALADGAVTGAKVASQAIDGTHVLPGSITSPLIAAATIQGGNIAAQTIYGGLVATDALDARTIAALAISADAMQANAILAGAIAAGSVTSSKLESDLVLASRLIAGTLTGNRVEMHPTLGLQAFTGGGTSRSFWLNSSTGAATMVGQIATAFSGSRIELNPGGNAPDSMRFWQGSAYAEIFADPAGTGAGVFMAGSGATKGKIGAYSNEGFSSWVNSSATAQSAISCTSGGSSVWGGVVSFFGEARWGSGLVTFGYRDGSGIGQAVRALQYKGAGSGEPALYSPNFDTQIVWLSGGMICQNAAGTTSKTFTNPSSRRLKKNEAPVVFGDRTALDIVAALEPKRWNYAGEWVEGEPEPPRRKVPVQDDDERDEQGRLLKPGRWREVDAPPEVMVKPHHGLMAEDVMAVAPDLVTEDPAMPGGLGLVDRDLIAVLWAAVRQLAGMVARPAAVPAMSVPPPTPGGGAFYERAGTLYYRTSTGVERKVA